ncbi:MAG: DUF3429 domain-containing protein [Rhizobiaceae bacterium]
MAENAEKLIPGRQGAWVLSLAGVLPFLALCIASFLAGKTAALFPFYVDAFKTWSVAILCFLGGIRWGMAILAKPVSPKLLFLSTLSAFAGWIALFLSDAAGVMLLLLAYSAQGAWDSFSIHGGEGPQWFADLRIVLTLMVAATHIVMLVAVF